MKKRSKKLLSVAGSIDFARLAAPPHAKGKSFLVLFFKKELLAFFCDRRAAPQANAVSYINFA
ncbi:MAG TPA: hypothetical protein VMB71_09320 [Acetobacteraceae bacterium]|nr:hypothetical protein [Acetobacteraceae bacterium]